MQKYLHDALVFDARAARRSFVLFRAVEAMIQRHHRGQRRRGSSGVRSCLLPFGRDRKRAMSAYRSFVAAERGQPSPWNDLKNRVMPGDEAFVDAMQARMECLGWPLKNVSKWQRAGRSRSLDDYADKAADRDGTIARACAGEGYTLREIGDHFGLHHSRASRVVKLAEAKRKT